MIFNYNTLNCSPLVIDEEFEIEDEDSLAELVGMVILGHFSHVKRILKTLATSMPELQNTDYDFAIARLDAITKPDLDIDKRDGWIFQIISWIALLQENLGNNFYCQQPHDAPAQHGIDGVGITLDNLNGIKNIIITEDKCTENQRVLIPKIWQEFEKFEDGLHTNQLVSRISALIEHIDDGDVLEANKNEIYLKDRWKYRVGINRNDSYEPEPKRKKLFKGYDDCVKGTTPHRRYAATLHKENIREWMEGFSRKVIKYLESKKSADV